MVIITPPEGGRVTIGSAKNERGRDGSGDEDRTTASIPHTYAVATTEVTNRQFRAFLNDPEKGAYYRAALGIGEATAEVFATDEDLDYPATRVSWFMAVAYCNWLTEKEWKEEASDRFCYGPATYDGQDRFTIGMTVAAADEQMLGYRLLREAEWEFACRSGTQTRYCFGEAEQLVSNYAVRGDSVATVATLRPNDFGLFDMHGNVWEWCDSWYDSSEVSRVLRGGSFSGNARNVRSACRGGIQPGDRLQYVGFRVARTYR